MSKASLPRWPAKYWGAILAGQVRGVGRVPGLGEGRLAGGNSAAWLETGFEQTGQCSSFAGAAVGC